ncbi:MAG: GspMb/PilO family protein [Sedimentisphaerales bacterium]
MSTHERNKAGLQKEISSIFKGVPTPQTDGGQKPFGTFSAEQTGYIELKPPAPELQKPRVSKAYQAMQSLLKIAPEHIVYAEPEPLTLEPQQPQASKTNQATTSLPKAAPAQQPKVVPVQQHKVIRARQPKVVPAQRPNTMQTRQRLMTAGLIWAACFVVFLLAYMLVLGPQKKYEKHIENKLAERKQVYESALRAAQKETKIRLNEQIERLQSRLQDFVIDFEDSANLTFDISQIANEKEVASFSIKSKDDRGLSTIPECKYISENQIVISFVGGFNQFATFLNALERHRPVLFVDKFTITRSGQDDSGYQVSLNVAAFVKKQQDEGLLSEDGKTADKSSMKLYGKKI